MAKAPSSVVGVDIGRYSLKAVLLQRRGERLALTHYGSHVPETPPGDSESLGKQLKALMRDLGTSAKSCVVSVSSPEALIRIIEQPDTPTTILRDALRLNGMALLNQDVKSFVLDCDLIGPVASESENGGVSRMKYLVGGLPRTEVQSVAGALQAASISLQSLQLAPICVFNAFEFAHPEVFNEQAFILLDVGHGASTVVAGVKRDVVLIRTIEFGGKTLLEALEGLSGGGSTTVFEALEQEDEVMVEYTRVALSNLTREIGSSIGYFEARHEETISKVYVTGGPAKSKVFLKLMSEELNMPCEAWHAAAQCENALPSNRRADFERESVDLNVACGAAAEALKAQ